VSFSYRSFPRAASPTKPAELLLFAELGLLLTLEVLILDALLVTATDELLLGDDDKFVAGLLEFGEELVPTTAEDVTDEAAAEEAGILRMSDWIKVATFCAQAASQAAGSAGGMVSSIFLTSASKSLQSIVLHA
jgi:hypothetical protein